MSTKRFTWLLVVVSAPFLAVGAATLRRRATARRRRGGDTIKVGLVTDTGGVDDRGFNEFSVAGLEKAATTWISRSGFTSSNSADDYEPNLEAAVEDGNDLVVAVGFLLAPSAIKVATENPDVSFAGVDHFYGPPGDKACEESKTCAVDNALGMIFPTEEAGYLAGIVAALTTKTNTVSHRRRHQDPAGRQLDRGLPGRGEGDQAERQALERVFERLQRAAKCKEIALDQISQGSDVVFQVAGDCGLGALDAACEKNVTAIGVDADQSCPGGHASSRARSSR